MTAFHKIDILTFMWMNEKGSISSVSQRYIIIEMWSVVYETKTRVTFTLYANHFYLKLSNIIHFIRWKCFATFQFGDQLLSAVEFNMDMICSSKSL